MRNIIGKIAWKIFSWSVGDKNVMPIVLPVDVVEREATSADEYADYDLYILHSACVDAWRSVNR